MYLWGFAYIIHVYLCMIDCSTTVLYIVNCVTSKLKGINLKYNHSQKNKILDS